MSNSTRIRYLVKSDGLLQSVKTFAHETSGARYFVQINQKEDSFRIVEELSNTEVASSKACNLHQLKIKAKAKLQELGIVFGSEERTKANQPLV